jgi:hypothetical protein
MKPQERAAKTVSARPRSLRHQSPADPVEEGLSLDPEQLGERFLDYATGNSRPAPDGIPELQLTGAPASDEAVDGSHFSTSASTWENTVRVAMEQGKDDDITEDVIPSELAEDTEREPERGVAEVDLTASVIKEASLLDEESSVLGETIPKQPRTDDTGGARRAQGEDESG